MPGYTEALSESRPISSWKADHGLARAVRSQGSGEARLVPGMVPSGAEAPLVIIVDDDEAVRLALEDEAPSAIQSLMQEDSSRSWPDLS